MELALRAALIVLLVVPKPVLGQTAGQDTVAVLIDKAQTLMRRPGSDAATNRKFMETIRAAIDLARARHNQQGELNAINTLRRYHFINRENDSAIYDAKLALTRAESFKDSTLIEQQRGLLGGALVAAGHVDSGLVILRAVLARARAHKSPAEIAAAVSDLGWGELSVDPDSAIGLAREEMEFARTRRDTALASDARALIWFAGTQKGGALIKQKRARDAVPYLLSARMSVDSANPDNVIQSDTALASAYVETAHQDSAILWLKDALAVSVALQEGWRAAPVLARLVEIESSAAKPDTLLSHLRLLLSAQMAIRQDRTRTLHQLAETYEKLNLPDSARSALIEEIVALKQLGRDSPALWEAYSDLGMKFFNAGTLDSATMFTRLAVEENHRYAISRRVQLGAATTKPTVSTAEECSDYTALFLNLFSLYHRMPSAHSDSAIVIIAEDLDRLHYFEKSRRGSSRVPAIETMDKGLARRETVRSLADLAIRSSASEKVAENLAASALAARERLLLGEQAPGFLVSQDRDTVDCDFRALYSLSSYDPTGANLMTRLDLRTPVVAYSIIGNEVFVWSLVPAQYSTTVSVQRLEGGANLAGRFRENKRDNSLKDALLPATIFQKLPQSGSLIISPDPAMAGVDFGSLTTPGVSQPLGARYTITIAPNLTALIKSSSGEH